MQINKIKLYETYKFIHYHIILLGFKMQFKIVFVTRDLDRDIVNL